MSFRVPGEVTTLEVPKIKGSRFIADVSPVADEEQALAHVARVAAREHAARHVAWAYRLGADGGVCRSSDAGEPSGSAGRPILAAIEGADLTFVCVTVTRYFGGTKLGVGGLVRAYGGCAAEGLAETPAREIVPVRPVSVEVPYDALGLLETFLAREAVERPEGRYGEVVRFTFAIPSAEAEEFAARLVDATHGRGATEVGAEETPGAPGT